MTFFSSRPHGTFVGAATLFVTLDTWGHLHAYVSLPFLDIVTHFLFGFGCALLLTHRMNIRVGVKVFLLVFLLGSVWEGIEFVYDHLLAFPFGYPVSQHGIDDTLVDLVSSSAGAILTIILFRRSEPEEPMRASVSEEARPRSTMQ